jgi:hypothetical protein
MPDCSYCDAAFPDEASYREHLRAEHADELDRIDRKRAGLDRDDGDGPPVVLYAVLVGGVALALVGVYLVASGSPTASGESGGVTTPHDYGAVHVHGTIEVSIDGQTVDFGRQRYQMQDRNFHFEEDNANPWHVHARGVTLAYAMETVGIELGGGGDTLAFDGTTYRDGDDGTSVSVTVNGEPVNPSEYVLQDGDTVRIVVRTE